MELEEFVRSSIIQIMRGVEAAQKEWNTPMSGAGVISPAWDGPDDFINRVQEVKFDVAVTAAGKTDGGGQVGIRVVGIDLSGKIGRSTDHSTISRIAFSIPVLPPTTVIKKLGPPSK